MYINIHIYAYAHMFITYIYICMPTRVGGWSAGLLGGKMVHMSAEKANMSSVECEWGRGV